MKPVNIARLCVVALAAAMVSACQAAPPPTFAKVPNYQALYVFGDSLSDTGNDIIATRAKSYYPPVPPSESPHRTYYQGRFSNGPVAFEYLWRRVARPVDKSLTPSLAGKDFSKMTGVSFAFGGSGAGGVTMGPGGFDVPGVLAQVQMFKDGLYGKMANEQALYAVWSGANDYLFNHYTDPGAVVGNLATAIETLYRLGARSFLVPNLPDIGLSPLAQIPGEDGIVPAAGLTMLVNAHNSALASALDNLAARLPGILIVRVDVFTLTQQLVAAGYVPAPALELIAPGTGAVACLFVNPMTCPDVNVAAPIPPLLFWDALHPTTQVHEQVAKAMYDRLAE